jgi:hypothetical protein
LLHGAIQLRGVSIEQRHVGALVREDISDAKTDPTRGSGDDGGTPCDRKQRG